MSKKPYVRPEITKYSRIEDMPVSQQAAASEIVEKLAKDYDSIVDRDRRWVSVSENFASILGYRVMDLVGRRVDDFTTPGSMDLDFVFDIFFRIGEMDRLWMFKHNSGKSVVVRYRARLTDEFSFAQVKPLLVA